MVKDFDPECTTACDLKISTVAALMGDAAVKLRCDFVDTCAG